MAKLYQDPFKYFSTTSEFINFLDDPDTWAPDNNFRNSASHESGGGWRGTASWEEAIKLAKNGWQEGTNKLGESVELLRTEGRSRNRIRDVAGDFPDVGRYLSGLPDCMSRRVINQGLRRPIIPLVFNIGANCHVDADVIMNIGAAFVKIIDDLEDSGYQTSLQITWVCDSRTQDEKGKQVWVLPTVEVKKPGQALDLAEIAFFCINPSSLRRLMFRFFEAVFAYPEKHSGYGHSAVFHQCPVLQDVYDEDSIFIDNARTDSDAYTPEAAVDYVTSQIRKQRPDLLQPEA